VKSYRTFHGSSWWWRKPLDARFHSNFFLHLSADSEQVLICCQWKAWYNTTSVLNSWHLEVRGAVAVSKTCPLVIGIVRVLDERYGKYTLHLKKLWSITLWHEAYIRSNKETNINFNVGVHYALQPAVMWQFLNVLLCCFYCKTLEVSITFELTEAAVSQTAFSSFNLIINIT